MFSNLFRLLNIQTHIQCTGKMLYILKLPILGIAQMGIALIFRDFETLQTFSFLLLEYTISRVPFSLING